MGGQAQALQFARRQAWRAAIERQVTETQRQQHLDARRQVVGNAPAHDQLFGVQAFLDLARRVRVRRQQLGQARQRQAREFGDVHAGKRHRQRLAPQALAFAFRTRGADHVARHALFHRRAFGIGKGLHHVAAHAGERALVAGRVLALERGAGFCGRQAAVHGHARAFLGIQNPVAVLLRQIAPRGIDVVAQRHQNVAQVLAVPGRRPGGNGPFADRQAVVRDHRLLGHLEHAPHARAARACALRRVGRKRFGVQQLLPGRIIAGTRIQHAQRIGQRADAADR